VPQKAILRTSHEATEARVIAVSGAYTKLLLLVFFVFLLFSDWVVLGGPLLVVRRVLVAVVMLVPLPFAFRNRRVLAHSLAAPPLVLFAAFLVLGLALSPLALAPTSSALHALALAGVLLFAVAIATAMPLATTLAVIRLTLGLKLLGSLGLGLFGFQLVGSPIFGTASASLRNRHGFGGVFGNPNPLCDAATLYLLLAACHLIESRRAWPTGWRQWVRAAWFSVTVPVAAYLMWQSLSRSSWVALAITAIVVSVLSRWHVAAPVSTRRRLLLVAGSALVLLVAIPALIIWINISRGVIHGGGTLMSRLHHAMTSGAVFDTSKRPLFWELALTDIQKRPWTGYGMVSTPLLYAPHFAGRPEHSHNLELEAALYTGVPGALLVVLFVVASARGAVKALIAHRPFALSVGAALIFLLILAQAEPAILGSPYPGLPIVLALVCYLRPSR
jgi:O-antigen ligase